ncbi:hypothetical protein EGW08_008491 [Elysia chlorotica]|uniref:Uncharacterized protein n=1 Tax=Elysia chlorotica TaxID=188477 RepID=A0A433TQE8_ELYCH|nr:hypothetical protein EGW08_008491 [Elysia chlorotica]
MRSNEDGASPCTKPACKPSAVVCADDIQDCSDDASLTDFYLRRYGVSGSSSHQNLQPAQTGQPRGQSSGQAIGQTTARTADHARQRVSGGSAHGGISHGWDQWFEHGRQRDVCDTGRKEHYENCDISRVGRQRLSYTTQSTCNSFGFCGDISAGFRLPRRDVNNGWSLNEATDDSYGRNANRRRASCYGGHDRFRPEIYTPDNFSGQNRSLASSTSLSLRYPSSLPPDRFGTATSFRRGPYSEYRETHSTPRPWSASMGSFSTNAAFGGLIERTVAPTRPKSCDHQSTPDHLLDREESVCRSRRHRPGVGRSSRHDMHDGRPPWYLAQDRHASTQAAVSRSNFKPPVSIKHDAFDREAEDFIFECNRLPQIECSKTAQPTREGPHYSTQLEKIQRSVQPRKVSKRNKERPCDKRVEVDQAKAMLVAGKEKYRDHISNQTKKKSCHPPVPKTEAKFSVRPNIKQKRRPKSAQHLPEKAPALRRRSGMRSCETSPSRASVTEYTTEGADDESYNAYIDARNRGMLGAKGVSRQNGTSLKYCEKTPSLEENTKNSLTSRRSRFYVHNKYFHYTPPVIGRVAFLHTDADDTSSNTTNKQRSEALANKSETETEGRKEHVQDEGAVVGALERDCIAGSSYGIGQRPWLYSGWTRASSQVHLQRGLGHLKKVLFHNGSKTKTEKTSSLKTPANVDFQEKESDTTYRGNKSATGKIRENDELKLTEICEQDQGHTENVNIHENPKSGHTENVNIHENPKSGHTENLNIHENPKIGHTENVNIHENHKSGHTENVNIHENHESCHTENVNIHENPKSGPIENVKIHEDNESGHTENVNIHDNPKSGHIENVKIHEDHESDHTENVNILEDHKSVKTNILPNPEENARVPAEDGFSREASLTQRRWFSLSSLRLTSSQRLLGVSPQVYLARSWGTSRGLYVPRGSYPGWSSSEDNLSQIQTSDASQAMSQRLDGQQTLPLGCRDDLAALVMPHVPSRGILVQATSSKPRSSYCSSCTTGSMAREVPPCIAREEDGRSEDGARSRMASLISEKSVKSPADSQTKLSNKRVSFENISASVTGLTAEGTSVDCTCREKTRGESSVDGYRVRKSKSAATEDSSVDSLKYHAAPQSQISSVSSSKVELDAQSESEPVGELGDFPRQFSGQSGRELALSASELRKVSVGSSVDPLMTAINKPVKIFKTYSPMDTPTPTGTPTNSISRKVSSKLLNTHEPSPRKPCESMPASTRFRMLSIDTDQSTSQQIKDKFGMESNMFTPIKSFLVKLAKELSVEKYGSDISISVFSGSSGLTLTKSQREILKKRAATRRALERSANQESVRSRSPRRSTQSQPISQQTPNETSRAKYGSGSAASSISYTSRASSKRSTFKEARGMSGDKIRPSAERRENSEKSWSEKKGKHQQSRHSKTSCGHFKESPKMYACPTKLVINVKGTVRTRPAVRFEPDHEEAKRHRIMSSSYARKVYDGTLIEAVDATLKRQALRVAMKQNKLSRFSSLNI